MIRRAAVLVVLLLLMGCADHVTPRFERVENVRLSTTTARQAMLMGDLVVFNPNPVAVHLVSMDLEISSAGVHLADMDQPVEARLAARSESPIALVASIDPADLVGDGLDGLLNMGLSALTNQSVPVLIEGDLGIGLGQRTVTVPVRSEHVMDLDL